MSMLRPRPCALFGPHQRNVLLWCAAITVLGGNFKTVCLSRCAQAQSPAPAANTSAGENPYLQRIPAPGLDGGKWVNVAKPLSLAKMRGRFVLLDFWTYCCINCMHVLPELKKLEHAFPNELVIVGIHSAKFAGEHVTDNIREAALRYEIEHPIVNDSKMAIWNRYGARSWPTLVLIDPAGDVVWAASGELTFEEMKEVIDRGLPYYKSHGLLKPAPRPTLISESRRLETAALKFPGKVLADETNNRLFIADSNHNRIVIATLDGKLLQIVGSGAIGRADGTIDKCSFNHPQGMALANSVLFVSDTENHLLRKVDLSAKRVTTIAGTGKKGSAWADLLGDKGGKRSLSGATGQLKPLSTSLSSPWALWHQGNDLYIAMAGMHQIWKMPLDESSIGPYAGNGRENNVNGPLLPRIPYDQNFASFAQPSGITSDGKQLFVADSEGSSIRSVPFDSNGTTQTLVGPTNTLFDFGDADGTGSDVRLQHPLGVAWEEGKLYVADTYNNKIKVIDAERRTCRTVAGTDRAGNVDAEKGSDASLNEPAGISTANGRLYVADTNNHAIRVVELAAPNRVTTLKIEGLAVADRESIGSE